MELVKVDVTTLGELEDLQRGRKANPETVQLFNEALAVIEEPGVYVGWERVYPDKKEAYDSVAKVVEYAKRRGYMLHQRLMPVYEDGQLIGYRCVVRASYRHEG